MDDKTMLEWAAIKAMFYFGCQLRDDLDDMVMRYERARIDAEIGKAMGRG